VIDVAVFEDASGERQLLGAVIEQEATFHEHAAVEAREIDLRPKVEIFRVKCLVSKNALLSSLILSRSQAPLEPQMGSGG
jgi:hypothetical protein